jgi:hypothetical protein
MAASVVDRPVQRRANGISRTFGICKIAAATKILKGTLVAKNLTGFLVAAANTAGLKVVGVALATVDNTAGADGALSVGVETGVFKFLNDGVAPCVQADVFGTVFASDNQTIRTRAGSLGVAAGLLEQIDADGVWIKIEPEILQQSLEATVSDTQTTPGSLVTYTFDIADAASADYDRVVDQKIEIMEVVLIKNGAGAGNTTTIKNGANPITDVMATAVDKTVTRAGTIDRAFNVIPAGGTLRVSVARAAGLGGVKGTIFAVRRA